MRNGIVISLAHAVPQEVADDVNETGPFYRTTNRIGPTGTTDTSRVSFHSLTVVPMDTWCHFVFEGMCNGIPAEGNRTEEEGCKEGSVMNWRDGVPLRHVSAQGRRVHRT